MKNWAGNYSYLAKAHRVPETVDELASIVRESSKVHAVGTRHSFSSVADSEGGTLVSLEKLNRVIRIDRGAQSTVTIEGGVTYAQLCPILANEGLALHNLASLPHIAVAGACATATHGSGVTNGNLSTAVVGMRIIKADGSSEELAGDALQGAVVSLGALGVVSQLTLKLEPAFTVRQNVFEHLPLAQLRPNFEAILSGAYSVSLFTDWHGDTINQVWLKRREADGELPTALLAGATPATETKHPIDGCDPTHSTGQLGIAGEWYDRLPHFRIGVVPSAGNELQSEYFIAREHAAAAFDAIDTLRNEIAPLVMISEIRTIAADRFWMSMCYERDSVAFHFTWKPDWRRVSTLLPKIEAKLRPFAPRPHWGKLFTMPADEVRSRYPRLVDFRQLIEQFDPDGKFENKFSRRSL